MDLKEWMQLYKVSYRSLAEQTGIQHATIWRYAHKQRTPSLGHAITIERLTEGKVTVFDLAEEDHPDQTDPPSVDSSMLSGVPS